jgi:NhaP-type Na+/H+ and K+/H+ antiporter
MLLSERRRALIYLCLAGMEAAWATPFLLLLYRRMPSVWAAYGVLLGALLAWILVLDLLNRTQVASPLYQVIVMALIAITSLAILVLSPGSSAPPAPPAVT